MTPIDTERLVLRELVDDDWRAMRALDTDPQVVRYMSNDVVDEAATRAYMQRSIASAREQPRRSYDFAITARPDATLLGRAGFRIERPEHKDAMIWFVVRRELWGKGYVTEAMRAVLRV